MSHRDTVFEAPAGFTALASSTESPVAAFEVVERGLYGIQFHPEVVHTPYGQDVLKTFLGDVCGCEMTWSGGVDHRRADRSASATRSATARSSAACRAASTPSVAALLVHRAIGDQLTCVFVDHGLMRKNEGEQVIYAFRDHFKVPLVAVDAEDRFLDEAAGRVASPRRSARRSAPSSSASSRRRRRSSATPKFLVQGTLYSDVIESGGGTGAATIKSHHNVGGLPEDLEFELVEPLRALFKDEVRAVGAELGLPERLVWRQPFPGPGLAIRVVGGEATKERLDLLRDADYILQDEIRKAGLYRELWQSFCVLPDIRTVGVQGDERTYGYVVVIRAVTSDDAMTADWARLPYDLLEQIAARMIGELREVNRVVLDITSKPPGHDRVGIAGFAAFARGSKVAARAARGPYIGARIAALRGARRRTGRRGATVRRRPALQRRARARARRDRQERAAAPGGSRGRAARLDGVLGGRTRPAADTPRRCARRWSPRWPTTGRSCCSTPTSACRPPSIYLRDVLLPASSRSGRGDHRRPHAARRRLVLEWLGDGDDRVGARRPGRR